MTDQQLTDGTSAWVVWAGEHGEDEDTALEDGIAIIGFYEYGDATGKTTRDEIEKLVREGEDEAVTDGAEPLSPHQIGSFVSQFFAFTVQIQTGDIVVLPLKTRSGQLAIGRCTGDYEYRKIDGDYRHVRPVDWERVDAERTDLKSDLRRSVCRPPTVFRVQRNSAVQRLDAVRQSEPDPGPPGEIADVSSDETVDETLDAVSPDTPLPERALDEIRDAVRERFTGHDFARLIDGILSAQGYITQRSAPGPDGGVDILAGRGLLGFDEPRLCVQVKATAAVADVKVVRELQGAMQSFGANHGLFVCWGGFTRDARTWARDNHFNVRLWDADDVVEALQDVYDKLAEEIRAEIPLKQVWTLVRDDDL